MWFCDIPLEYKVGRNLPWFRSREILDPSPRQEVKYKPYPVSNLSDLEKIPNSKVTLKLSPDADLIRNDEFIDKVISKATTMNLPVQLEGSILSHTYYRLNQANIPIVNPNAQKYHRKRKPKVFGKLVRDKIPDTIAKGGEMVKEAKLAQSDMQIGLAGKFLEELDEYLRSDTQNESAAELADLLEVLKGLATWSGHNWETIEKLAKNKASKRGGFKDGRILIETTFPNRDSSHERIELVSASELIDIDIRENTIEVSPSALVSTSKGQGLIFSFQEDSERFRLSINNGKLQISRLNTKTNQSNDRQKLLF